MCRMMQKWETRKPKVLKKALSLLDGKQELRWNAERMIEQERWKAAANPSNENTLNMTGDCKRDQTFWQVSAL